MTRPIVFSLLLAVIAGGCADRARINPDCQWTGDSDFPLDLRNPAHRRHLNDDVRLAEDLGVRFADARVSPPRVAVRKQCMDALFATIVTTHRVRLADVLAARGQRSRSWDAAVVGAFGILYVFAAWLAVRRVSKRFTRDERLAALGAVIGVSIVFSVAGVIIGELWSVSMETLRLGNDHLAPFRGDRIPWVQHRIELGIAGLVLFWAIAAAQYARVAGDCAADATARTS